MEQTHFIPKKECHLSLLLDLGFLREDFLLKVWFSPLLKNHHF